MREISIESEHWPIAGAFTISRGSKTEAEVVTVTIRENGATGRGECVPYGRYGRDRQGRSGLDQGHRAIHSGRDDSR